MISKHAGWFDFLKPSRLAEAAKNPYVIAAAAPVIGAGVDAGIGQVRKMIAARGKVKAYKSMIAENPVLKKRPKDSQKFFNTLYNANPDLARDPLVASSWVHTQIEQQVPGVPHAGVVEGVQTLTKIRQQMRDTTGRRGGTFQTLGEQMKSPLLEAHGQKQQKTLGDLRRAKGESVQAEGKARGMQQQVMGEIGRLQEVRTKLRNM